MRAHVGKHILDGECKDSQPCGFCGRGACSNRLADPTKRGGKKFYSKVLSNCPYYIDIKKRAKKSSIRYPCTNYLDKCPLCNADIWKYNIPKHYTDMHQGVEVPTTPTQDEIAFMKKIKL